MIGPDVTHTPADLRHGTALAYAVLEAMLRGCGRALTAIHPDPSAGPTEPIPLDGLEPLQAFDPRAAGALDAEAQILRRLLRDAALQAATLHELAQDHADAADQHDKRRT